MQSNDPMTTSADDQPASESAAAPAEVSEAEAELQRIRKLRVMAAVSAPLLMSLLMSKRANAWSPPPDPTDE
jgi:hypothetical protein